VFTDRYIGGFIARCCGYAAGQTVRELNSGMDNRFFSLLQTDQIDNEARSVSYLKGRGVFRGEWVKRGWEGREVDHSPPSSGDTENEWRHVGSSCMLRGLDRSKFYIHFALVEEVMLLNY
jgi:hypothetical protein